MILRWLPAVGHEARLAMAARGLCPLGFAPCATDFWAPSAAGSSGTTCAADSVRPGAAARHARGRGGGRRWRRCAAPGHRSGVREGLAPLSRPLTVRRDGCWRCATYASVSVELSTCASQVVLSCGSGRCTGNQAGGCYPNTPTPPALAAACRAHARTASVCAPTRAPSRPRVHLP